MTSASNSVLPTKGSTWDATQVVARRVSKSRWNSSISFSVICATQDAYPISNKYSRAAILDRIWVFSSWVIDHAGQELLTFIREQRKTMELIQV